MKKLLLRRKPKRILRLPDLDHSKTAVLNTLSSPDSQRAYRFAIEDFVGCIARSPSSRSTKPLCFFIDYSSKHAVRRHPQ